MARETGDAHDEEVQGQPAAHDPAHPIFERKVGTLDDRAEAGREGHDSDRHQKMQRKAEPERELGKAHRPASEEAVGEGQPPEAGEDEEGHDHVDLELARPERLRRDQDELADGLAEHDDREQPEAFLQVVRLDIDDGQLTRRSRLAAFLAVALAVLVDPLLHAGQTLTVDALLPEDRGAEVEREPDGPQPVLPRRVDSQGDDPGCYRAAELERGPGRQHSAGPE